MALERSLETHVRLEVRSSEFALEESPLEPQLTAKQEKALDIEIRRIQKVITQLEKSKKVTEETMRLRFTF